MPFILRRSAHSTRQQTFWYKKITGWAQNKQKVKWGKYWRCKTSFVLDIHKPLARHYSVQIQLLELSTAVGTILKAQKQKCSNNRQWLCSCPCSALCSVHWTHQPHLHVCMYAGMYSNDYITYQLSPQNLYTAVFSMTWSLRLGSPQNGQAVLYLFWRHSQFQSVWLFLKQKKFGGTCAVNPLSPACHVNPTLTTNIYCKICDI